MYVLKAALHAKINSVFRAMERAMAEIAPQARPSQSLRERATLRR